MKKKFTSFLFLLLFAITSAQWSPTTFRGENIRGSSEIKNYYSLDISLLKSQLAKAQETGKNAKPVTISLPTLEGKIERFAVYSFPVVVKSLADQYQLGSYVGVGIDDPGKYLRFSLAPDDFQSMIIKDGKSEFIEPADKMKTVYGVHPKTDKSNEGFLCSMNEDRLSKQEIENLYTTGKAFNNQTFNFSKNSDKKYRTMRLAMSVTGEYTQYFGGTVAGALIAINASVTRVNAVFEKDFALHLDVQNFPAVIYTNPATDPYSPAATGAGGAWNGELQAALTANVGNANYDIGHLFGASGGGGNAGCIGCVCVNPTTGVPNGKGSGFTSPADGIPQGDNFDIDYVAHEMGHQLGGNHTFSHGLESAGVNQEPGSGSTIMGYAGITGPNTDVQPHSDPYFHIASIKQVQANLISKTCDIETTITNNPPVITALPTYNIPKGTAFVLTASATDPENDPMTYTWEEVDNASVVINKNNLGTTATGASFRSFNPTTSPTRYFPKLASVLAGVLNNSNNGWESVSTVARTTKFAVTVRDNNPVANQQQTQFAEQTIVVGNDGPFKVTTATAYNNGPTTVTWDVVNTTAAPYSVANVKIDYTTDNGTTWTVLSASTPNDGSESLTLAALGAVGSTAKIRVAAVGNVFYAIGNTTVASLAACTSAPPTGVVVSAITQTGATVSWAASAGATYVIQYRPVGSTTWVTVTSATNTVNLTGLTDGIQYEVQVANVCSGTQGTFSASTNFTTPGLTYCTMTSSNFASEYISNVTVTPVGAAVMSNNSVGSTYTDYSTTPSALVNLVIGSTNNTISVTKFFPGTVWSEAVGVWIDFNRNGVFETSEQVMNTPSNTNTPVTATFNVPATAYNGPSTTRMRVAMRYSTSPVMCQSFGDGEVEDYAVKLIQPIPCTSNAPLNPSVTNILATSAYVMWDPAIGATYILQYREVGATAWITVPLTANAYTINGLTESTQYEFQVAYVCSGTTGTFTAPIQFTTPAVTYCNNAPTANANGYISNVTITPTNSYVMSNDTGANSYTDYSPIPAKLITLVRTSTGNSISVSKSWLTTTQNSLAVGAWIDFNRNGIFETGERVISTTASITTPITATFTVPATSYNGPLTLRMRVIFSTSTVTDPCATVPNGEIEDYAVKIVDLQGCTTAAPTPIVVSNITASTALVSWLNSTGATYTLRYKAVASPTWITVNPATNPYTITSLNATTQYEVQVATICGGTTGPWSSSINFTTPAITYCNSGTATVTDAFINNITVTGANTPMMSNNSGPSTYTDYSTDLTKTVTLARSSTNNVLSVGRTILSGTYSTYAWIDFNGDGIFNNNPSTVAGGERIMNLGYSSTTPVTANFNVPANAYNGTNKVKMRVIVYFLTPADACSVLTSNGEVEDYLVKFVDVQPCTTAPPTNIVVTNIAATTATVSWLSSTGATYLVRWRTTAPIGAWNTSPTVTGNSYGITGLTEQTAYEVQVATICGGVTGAWSASTPFTTTPITYCNMTGTGTTDFISNVTINPVNLALPVMSNTSVQTNYISYTTPATLVNLDIGSTGNKITVAKGWSTGTQSDAVSAWIDFNRNGVFETSEQILNSASSTTTPVNALFNVPSTAYSGPLTTTMRVVLKRSSAPVMCQNAVNGEVEDYAVKLRPCATTTPTAPTFTAITHNSATVNWTAGTGNLGYLVQYRVLGTTTWTNVYASTLLGNMPLNLTGLIPATTYEVQVAAVCSNAPGTFTAIKTFTTRCDPTPPSVAISNITTNSALITWTPLVPSATYVMRYREVGTTTWTQVNLPAPPANTYTLPGLNPYTTYEVQVANICNGETTINPWSNPKVFTTERTCELPPPGLTITNLTPTTAVVVWDPFPGATYILRYRKVGIPSWTTIPVATNTLTLTGLTEMTKYEMQVVNVCNGTPGTYTQPYFFTTPTVIYCQQSSTSSANASISKVTVKPTGKPVMENASGPSTYTDYTGIPATFIELVQGSTGNEISIEKQLSGTAANAGIAVWIDFNRNGYFDINERVYSSPPNSTTPVSGTFSVPADAFVSMTDYKYVVMRVALSKDNIPVNCTSFQDGEVEDYTVRISKQAVQNPINQTDILIYPNPVKSVLYVKNISKRANHKIYNAAGQLVSSGVILNNKIDVSALINGVYVIDIQDGENISIQKKFIKE